jgi:hypothetical protein
MRAINSSANGTNQIKRRIVERNGQCARVDLCTKSFELRHDTPSLLFSYKPFGAGADQKAIPKDVDVLVTIDGAMDLSDLARAGRRLKGHAQTINLGADVFLADTTGSYLGRICHYRECHPRVLCKAQHCRQRNHLNDDLAA